MKLRKIFSAVLLTLAIAGTCTPIAWAAPLGLDGIVIDWEKFGLSFGIPLLLYLIGVIVVSIRRKTKKNSTPVLEPAPAPTPDAIVSRGIVGTGDQYKNNQFSIDDRVAIGRDPKRCHIVFDKKSAGVSGLHCELMNVSGAIQLIDRGSSYGTFMQSGKKLEVNVPETLHPGDGFYLGSHSNSFKVY